uniref:Ocl4 n=1 Tax=Arundo donax TaxID=35708 RepID=A0A0A9BU72_ARUDO
MSWIMQPEGRLRHLTTDEVCSASSWKPSAGKSTTDQVPSSPLCMQYRKNTTSRAATRGDGNCTSACIKRRDPLPRWPEAAPWLMTCMVLALDTIEGNSSIHLFASRKASTSVMLFMMTTALSRDPSVLASAAAEAPPCFPPSNGQLNILACSSAAMTSELEPRRRTQSGSPARHILARVSAAVAARSSTSCMSCSWTAAMAPMYDAVAWWSVICCGGARTGWMRSPQPMTGDWSVKCCEKTLMSRSTGGMSTGGGADKQPSADADRLGWRPPPYLVAMHARRSSSSLSLAFSMRSCCSS